MKLLKLAPIFVILLAGVASAQVGSTAVPFLLIAPGARAAGMGEAFISIADDATAVHWNPAGLGRYPLTGSWLNLKENSSDTVRSIVLIKNDLPENNYRQYDIWGIVNGRLAKWSNDKWINGSDQPLRASSSVESVVMRYTGLNEDAAAPYVDRLARANNGLAPESIDSLKNMTMPILPEDFLYKEEIEYGFEKLHKAWLELRINIDGFNQVRSDIYDAIDDPKPSTDKLDKIAFGFDRAITAKGDRSIWLPYDLILTDSVNCLGTDDSYIYIGTNNGLYRFDPDPERPRWSAFMAQSDSIAIGRITAIQKTGKHTLYIGTDHGLLSFTGREFKSLSSESGPPKGYINVIAAETDQNVWVASDDELYHYDGFKWQSALEKTFSIGEKYDKAVERFYGELGIIQKDRLLSEISHYNTELTDTVAAGQIIKLPYKFGYKGEITSLGVDEKKRLWIGTTSGVNLFDGESFHLFGYKVFEVSGPMTVQDIAAQFIPDRKQEKIEKLATVIREYNNLTSDQVEAGSKLLVYANALGSRINVVTSVSGKKTIVSTDQGVVEYDNGKWGRMHNDAFSESKVSNIFARNKELWVNSGEKISIYASPKKQITFMHSNYLVQLANDIYYEYFSFIYPSKDWGTFGVAVTYLSLGSQQRMSETGIPEGMFPTFEMALTLSYGTRLMNDLYGGISLRYINSHLSGAGAGREQGNGIGYSVAVDGGLIYDMSRRLTLAATVTNIGPDISYIDADQADPLPRKAALGVHYRLIDTPFHKLSAIAEGTKLLVDLNDDIKTEINEIIPHVGMEYWYSNYVGFRGGYVYDKIGYQKYFTLGFSMQYNSYRFDFAYIPPSSEENNRLGNTLRFSLNAGF